MRTADIAVASGFVSYTAAWSYISLVRFYSLNSFILDLGVNMQSAWDLVFRSSLYSFVYTFVSRGIEIFVSPVLLTGNYPFVLFFQSAFIGAGSLSLYGIGKIILGDERPAAIVSLAYLIYFPAAGINFFDFHYQALFPTLFLSGYYFFLKRRSSISLLLFFLSGLVHYPYTVFPLLFGLVILLTRWRNKREMLFASLLVSLCSVIILSNFLLKGVAAATAAGPGLFSFGYADAKILTFLLIFAPLLFIPLFSPRWLLFLLPYLSLMILSSTAFFFYPLLFAYQYPALFVPFVFLATLDGIKRLARGKGSRVFLMSIIVLASCAGFASVYEPYGPLNSYSAVNFNFYPMTGINFERFHALEELIHIIPPNSSLLVQNNMPEIFPLRNISTAYDAYAVPYYFAEKNQSSINAVLVDPYSFSFYQYTAYPYNSSMYTFFEQLWNTNNFGVYGEADGLMLLLKNYYGPVAYYLPLKMNFSATQLAVTSTSFINGTAITASNLSEQKVWFGPWTTLPPGSYSATFWLEAYDQRGNDSLSLFVTANDGATLLAQKELYGYDAKSTLFPVTLNFTIDQMYRNVEFIGFLDRWHGSISLYKVSLQQTAPPLAVPADMNIIPSQLYSSYINSSLIYASNISNTLLWYGPYSSLPAGEYNITFFIATTNSSIHNYGIVQVTSDHASNIIASESFTGAYFAKHDSLTLTILLPSNDEGLEFRGWIGNWTGSIILHEITIRKTASAIPSVQNFYADQLITQYQYNGNAIVAVNSSSSIVSYGPYITLPGGRYSVLYYIASANSSPSNLLQLQVTANDGSLILATENINASMLSNGPVSISLITNQTYQNVEFRVVSVNWSGILYVEKISLIKVQGDGL